MASIIPKDTYVGTYVGELISKDTWIERYGQVFYLFELYV